jgi:hypothetical protein
MKLISHRGNIDGKNIEFENHPDYIDKAISLGYDVEVDIWIISGDQFLGHDEPQFPIKSEWLNARKDKLWIHCKNIEAIEWFNPKNEFNYFWHDKDTLTLTSKKIIWAYPGKQPILNSIAVMPEIFNDSVSGCLGICSDFISSYYNIISKSDLD